LSYIIQQRIIRLAEAAQVLQHYSCCFPFEV
jgi:hypothetical protein